MSIRRSHCSIPLHCADTPDAVRITRKMDGIAAHLADQTAYRGDVCRVEADEPIRKSFRLAATLGIRAPSA